MKDDKNYINEEEQELNSLENKKINNKKEEKKENIVWEWTKSIVIAFAIAMIIKTFLFEPTRVQGSSMNMTLRNEDRVIVDKISLKFRELQRGDIIVMKYDKDHNYIKRIVGLPGETIQIIEGKVYINGKEHKEPYIHGDYTETLNGFEWKLKKDEYFVMGDNRTPGGSTDSRVFGPISRDRIRGVANFRFFPFNEFGMLK